VLDRAGRPARGWLAFRPDGLVAALQEFLLTWLAVAFATLLGSSLLSMMAVFSGSTGGDLDALLHLQAAAIPLAAVAVAWSLHVNARSPGTAGVSRRLWARSVEHTSGLQS